MAAIDSMPCLSLENTLENQPESLVSAFSSNLSLCGKSFLSIDTILHDFQEVYLRNELTGEEDGIVEGTDDLI